MNIRIVRNIDFWCGLPLCFLLSLLNPVVSFLERARPNHRPLRKILFVKFSEMGAILLSFPLMDRLKREYPDAQFYFLTFERNRGIFRFLAGIVPEKNLYVIRESPLGFVLDSWRVLMRLRREAIDAIFDLEFFSRISMLFTYLIHAPKRIGFDRYTLEGLYRGDLLTHRVSYNPLIHVTQNFLALGQEIQKRGKTSPELPFRTDLKDLVLPRYTSDKQAREQLLAALEAQGKDLSGRKLFLMNPGEDRLPLREWPLERFIELARLILRNPRACVIMIGGEDAARKARCMVDSVADARCFSLAGETSLAEVLELFLVADVLISNDCGLAHLAMLTPLRTLTFFGPESPRIFGPLTGQGRAVYSDWPCSPCLSAFNHRNSACCDNLCLKVITAENVFEQVLKGL